MMIHVNGIDLFYERTGCGRPLVMVHGNGENHTIFDETVELLKDRFTIYAIDSRCHGRSEYTSSLHYQDMADDVTAFLDSLSLKDVLFYGFSDGGIIGLLAAMKSERISTLVISGANLTPKGVRTSLRIFLKASLLLKEDPKIRLMLNEPDIREQDLKQIHAKTLVLAGEKDLIREGETRRIADGIDGAMLHIIAGEDHGSYIVHSPKLAKYLILADQL